MTTRGRLLRPKDAAAYIKERIGKGSVSRLAQGRCYGNGPAFHRIGSKDIGYKIEALDEYIESQVSTPLSSTSEARA